MDGSGSGSYLRTMSDHMVQLVTTVLAGVLSGAITAGALAVTLKSERKRYRTERVETWLLNVMRSAGDVKRFAAAHATEGYDVLVERKEYDDLMLGLAALIGNASHHEQRFEGFLRSVRLRLIELRNQRFDQLLSDEPVGPDQMVTAWEVDQLLHGLSQGCDHRLKGKGEFDTNKYLALAQLLPAGQPPGVAQAAS